MKSVTKLWIRIYRTGRSHRCPADTNKWIRDVSGKPVYASQEVEKVGYETERRWYP